MRCSASCLAGLLLGLLLCLPGCGDGDPTIRVRLLTADADGPPDQPAFLVSDADPDVRFPLTPVSGESGVYEAKAPSGIYWLRFKAGWRHLDIQGRPSRLTAGKDLAPIDFYLGRAGTVYVTMKERTYAPPSTDWKVERDVVSGHRPPVGAEVFRAFDKVTGIRIAPAEWRGQLRFTGTSMDGALCSPFVLDVGTPGRPFPFLRLIAPAPVTRYSVRLVAPVGSKLVPDGRVAKATVRRLPMPVVFEGRSNRGVVDLGRVPRVADGLTVEVGSTVLELPGAHQDAYHAVHVLALSEGEAVDVGVAGIDAPLDELRVRPASAHTYARAQLLRGEDGVRVRTTTGRQTWIARSGSTWAVLEVDVTGRDQPPVALPAFVEGGEVSGTAARTGTALKRPLGPGHRVLAIRLEGEEQVSGEGFDVIVNRHGGFRLDLPPGDYRVQAQGKQGLLGRPLPMKVGSGSVISRPIEIE